MKDGFSMQEIEQFGRTHRKTILFCVILLLSAIFSNILWESLSIWLTAIGGMLGLIFTTHIETFSNKAAVFIGNQDRTVKLIAASVAIAISVIFPPFFFLVIGLNAGITMRHRMNMMGGPAESEVKVEAKEVKKEESKKPEDKEGQ